MVKDLYNNFKNAVSSTATNEKKASAKAMAEEKKASAKAKDAEKKASAKTMDDEKKASAKATDDKQDDKNSNASKIIEKTKKKTPLWFTFIKSAMVFILMTLCGSHYISLTRLTNNELDSMFPNKVKSFPYFIESSSEECPSWGSVTGTAISAIVELQRATSVGEQVKARAKPRTQATSQATSQARTQARSRAKTMGGGGLYACPSRPFSDEINVDNPLTKKKDYLVWPYSMAFDVENPGKKKVLDDSILVQTFGGDSFERYGTTRPRSYLGSTFAESMCFVNSGLRSIITNSSHLYDCVLILFQIVIFTILIIMWAILMGFTTLKNLIWYKCGSENRSSAEDSWFRLDSWPFLEHSFTTVIFNWWTNPTFYAGVLFQTIWKLYFQQLFLGNFEEIKRVIHCNLPFIALLFPLIFWTFITTDQINDTFGETTYITMGICWLIMAGMTLFKHFS